MKKLLLFAAIAATLGASAQEAPALKQLSKAATDVNAIFGAYNQCIGKDGKFFIQNGVDQKIEVFNAETGAPADEFIASTGGTPLAIDDAGNFILSVQTFPNAFAGGEGEEDFLLIIPADGGDAVQVGVPEFLKGRIDLFGKASGDLLGEDGGHLYLTSNAAGANDIYDLVIVEGELDARHSATLVTDVTVSPTTVTTVSGYTNAAGEEHILYYTRNAAAIDFLNDGGDLTGTTLALPDKGFSCGAWPFSLGGRDFILYPAKLSATNYLDAFAIAEIAKDEEGNVTATLVAETEETIATSTARQIHNLNVEIIDANTAKIYQFVPGNYFAVYEFKVGGEEPVEKKIYIDKSSEGNFWAWDKTGEEWRNYFDPWPGKAINELETEEVNGVECYVFEFTGESDFGMLFNDGSAQTDDIVPEWGKVYKYNGGTTYEVSDVPEQPVEAEYYVVGDFNGWDKESTKVKLEPNDDGDLETSVDLAANDEFKIITPADDTPDGWRYLGGIDENQMGYYLLNDETLGFPTELVDGSNFRVEKGGNYTLLLRKMVPDGAAGIALADGEVLTLTVIQNSITAVEDINVNNIASVKYVNLAGQVSATPFDGVNIQVTTMKDGSKKALKVVK